jgi:hypothetical protein
VQLSYPGMATRLVDKNGKFSWKQQKVFLMCRATVFRGNGVGSTAHYFVGAGAWGTA